MSIFSPRIQYTSNAYTTTNYSASKKAESVIIVDNDVTKNKEYQTIVKILSRLIESGVTKMGEGYCISVSDIIFNLLTQYGIKCHLKEVKLSILDQKTKFTNMVGHETTFTPNSYKSVATHVVVVTDTEIPILIDASIAHKLPEGKQVVMQKAENLGNRVLCNFEFANFGFIYQEKIDGIGIPQLHQMSILDRIGTDKRIFDTMKQLKMLNIIGIVLSAFALINVFAKVFLDWYN